MQGRFGMKPYRFTGCIFSINPDAYSTSEIDLTRWGLAMARKGGVPRERVLNALDLSSFREYLRTRKMGRSNEQAPLARFDAAY